MPSCLLLGVSPRSPPRPAALRLLLRRRSMASSAPNCAFQLRLNPLTGDSEWLVVDEAEEEGKAAPSQHKQLLAATSYLDMLNDASRNCAYRRAIDATVTDPAARILDIGAGTGLLSMMAARALASIGGEGIGNVSACESYLPMGKLMRRVLRANGMENKVKLFHKRSDELKVGVELDSPADILVSEILDSELLGEGLIPTLQHAHDMLLMKNPKTVPYRATIYGQLSGRSSPTCIVADDSVFLALLVSSILPSSDVIAMFPGLRSKGANYLQALADTNNLSMDHIKVIGRRVPSITIDDLKHKKIDLLLGEPFYYGSEGMLPFQNLRFWNERTLLKPLLAEDAFIMPCKGILRFCAMSLPDLWKSRCSLKDVEGFDHSVVNNTLGACSDLPGEQQGPCLPYYVWQCGYTKKLSKVYSLMDFDFSKPIHSCFGKTKIEFVCNGVCHGFAVWMDWVLDDKNSIVIATGPESRYWKQGVQLLSKPVEVNPSSSVMRVEACLDPQTGDLTFKSALL